MQSFFLAMRLQLQSVKINKQMSNKNSKRNRDLNFLKNQDKS